MSSFIRNDIIDSNEDIPNESLKRLNEIVRQSRNKLLEMIIKKVEPEIVNEYFSHDTENGKTTIKDFEEVMADPRRREKISELIENSPTLVEVKEVLTKIDKANIENLMENYQGQINNIKWPEAEENKRRLPVVNSAGKEICVLEEVEVKGRGNSEISAYRAINFPISTNGNADFFMAARNADGSPVALGDGRDAYRLCVHYNSKGELTSVEHPEPLHFDGKGKDAVAYFIRNDKKFTLPITRENYYELTQEVLKRRTVSEIEVEKQQQAAATLSDDIGFTPTKQNNQGKEITYSSQESSLPLRTVDNAEGYKAATIEEMGKSNKHSQNEVNNSANVSKSQEEQSPKQQAAEIGKEVKKSEKKMAKKSKKGVQKLQVKKEVGGRAMK